MAPGPAHVQGRGCGRLTYLLLWSLSFIVRTLRCEGGVHPRDRRDRAAGLTGPETCATDACPIIHDPCRPAPGARAPTATVPMRFERHGLPSWTEPAGRGVVTRTGDIVVGFR